MLLLAATAVTATGKTSFAINIEEIKIYTRWGGRKDINSHNEDNNSNRSNNGIILQLEWLLYEQHMS